MVLCGSWLANLAMFSFKYSGERTVRYPNRSAPYQIVPWWQLLVSSGLFALGGSSEIIITLRSLKYLSGHFDGQDLRCDWFLLRLYCRPTGLPIWNEFFLSLPSRESASFINVHLCSAKPLVVRTMHPAIPYEPIGVEIQHSSTYLNPYESKIGVDPMAI